MPSESELRDYLADNLALIDPSLSLVAREYLVPNSHGARGFVDLLARDPFGHLVIIEIKKSDKTAREAIHELFKYAVLIQTASGIPSEKLRCLVVSTIWHELLVPFSEFQRSADFHVEGYQLSLSTSGKPVRAEPIKPLERPAEVRLYHEHAVFLFETAQGRDGSVAQLAEIVDRAGAGDFAILVLDHHGPNPNVVTKFALYLVIGDSSPRNQKGDEEEEPESKEAKTLCRICEEMIDHQDAFEIGYPEKFQSLLVGQGWTVSSIRRGGRLAAGDLVDDAEILRFVGGVDGTNRNAFQNMAAPRFPATWRSFRAALADFLSGLQPWDAAVSQLLDEWETAGAPAVSAHVYSPRDILLSLYKLSTESAEYVPAMEIVSGTFPTTPTRLLLGFVEWDQRTLPTTLNQVMSAGYTNVHEYLFAVHFHATEVADARIMAAMGLSYGLIEARLENGTWAHYRLVQEGNSFVRKPDHTTGATFNEFALANQPFLANLVGEIHTAAKFV